MLVRSATIFLICICWLFCPAQKPHYQFSHLNISHGLSNNQVTSFYKDEKGFLWIGTLSGLNRYDGYQFKVFRHDVRDSASLPGDFITRIMEGPGNRLWIETRNGFTIYDPATEKFERNINSELKKLGLPTTPISGITRNKDGYFLFFMNRRAIYKYDINSKKTILLYDVSKTGNTIAAFAEDNNKQCWLIYDNGVAEKMDTRTGKITGRTDVPAKVYGSGSNSYSLFIDNENDLWINASAGNPIGGVVRYNPVTGQYIHLEKDKGTARLNTNLVFSVQQDDKDNIWICTDHGGINLYNKTENTIQYILNNTDDNKTLSQNSITASYKDDAGIIWLGTFKEGINYYHENIIKFAVYRHHPSDPNSLSFDDVNRFVEDGSGNIWIGTNGGGLLYFDRTSDRFTQYLHQPGNTNSISNNVIVSLFIDDEQNLWIGSYFGGLDCFKNGKFTHYRHDDNNPGSLTDDRVWEIFEDSKKNLWIGTLNGGLDRFDRHNNYFYHHTTNQRNSIHSNYVAAILEDKEGQLWIGTDNGIDVLNTTTGAVTQYLNNTNNPEGLGYNNVISLLEDSKGLIWVGTRDGLNVFNKKQKTFQSFRMENGLPDNTILNILEDNNHLLWISTTKGVSKINVTVNTGPGEPVNISCINYDELDGLQGTEFNENAALKTSKGEIIFGGASGFNLFQPDQIATDHSQPRLVLTDLQIFNKPVSVGEKINGRVILSQSISNTQSISLKYNENILAIEFAALNFSNSEKIKYEYMLEGFNKDWVVTNGKMRKAIYTNLDPGSYTFRLKASNEDGKWSEKEVRFKVKILPPFWRTPLAFILYVLVIVLALWIGRMIIVERTKMRFEVEHQRKEAERVQHLDVLKTKFFTNVSHEFRTPLSLILSPLENIIKKSANPEQKKQLQLVQRNAKRLLNLVNQLLDFRKMEIQEFNVQLSKQDIIGFSRDITCSFSDISEKKDIELLFKTNIEVLETYFDKDKVEKILFNLLSNAFKYTPPGGKVFVDISLSANPEGINSIQVKVRDSGIGIPRDMHEKIFERFYQHTVPGDIQSRGSGIGLVITKEFVKLHGGTIAVESEPEKGTCFIVTLPIKDVHEVPSPGNIKEEIIIPAEEPALAENGTTDKNKGGLKKSNILLVEDNEDFRFYLKDNLKHRYHVTEAINGRDGWEKIKQLQPDLVVSDVMMPVLDGIELSKRIKTDPRTSHIPVILLTAMSNEETELVGFRAGANDYVTKPFTFEILASRIRNLLNIQEQMRKKFQKQVDISPAEITITPLDEEFMKQAFDAVERNMDNPEFSVEDLSHDLFMSRVALYKKILSLTGKTPIEFIRIMRLKRAAQLLQKSQKKIAEIAYEVGYNNPKIFTRYFKEEFGSTPSEYQSQKH